MSAADPSIPLIVMCFYVSHINLHYSNQGWPPCQRPFGLSGGLPGQSYQNECNEQNV